MKYLFLALNFLTIVPVSVKGEIRPGDLGRSGFWFPVIGLFIGSCVYGIGQGVETLFSPGLSALIMTVVWVAMTGGLHLDGLADCCDGLLHPSTKERRLEIMKDSRIGAFGVVGLILFLLLKIMLVNDLLIEESYLPILLGPALGRWFILISAKQPLAKLSGMGVDFAQGINYPLILVSGILPLGIAVLMGYRGILAIIFSAILVAGIHSFSRSRIGGVTGDILGLIIELVEVAVMLGCLLIGKLI